MADFNSIAEKTFKFEGGYQNHPTDTANFCNGVNYGTNRGISAIAYKGFYGVCPTVAQMKSLTAEQAKVIYKKNYWDIIQGDLIANQSVAHIFFDAHIASGGYGLKRIRKYINKYYGTPKIKENFSGLTAEHANLINAADPKKLFEIAKQGEIENRNKLATANPAKYGLFLKGWLNRLNQITFDGTTFIKNNPAIIVVFAIIAMTITYFTINTIKAA